MDVLAEDILASYDTFLYSYVPGGMPTTHSHGTLITEDLAHTLYNTILREPVKGYH